MSAGLELADTKSMESHAQSVVTYWSFPPSSGHVLGRRPGNICWIIHRQRACGLAAVVTAIELKHLTMNCLQAAWNTHATELRHWTSRRLADSAEVEDLLQDLFLKAMRQGERFCSVDNARAWLFEVARNALTDRLRARRDSEALHDDLPETVEETATVDQLVSCLPRVLSELNEKDREAITWCDLQGMPQAEFARLKDLSVSGASHACNARGSGCASAWRPHAR